MVAVSVSGHGVVFMVPMGPKALTRGDIIEVPDYEGYYMITGMDLLDGPGQYRIRAVPAMGSDFTRNGEIAWRVSHGDWIHVMKAER